jgi:hypothetical protein
MMIVEATAVSPEGRITPWNLGLYSDANEQGLERVRRGRRGVPRPRDALRPALALACRREVWRTRAGAAAVLAFATA